MKNVKRLGIWMDHTNAHIMEFSNDTMETKKIETDSTATGGSEHTMHNKAQHQQTDYYKKLGEVIKNYDSVVLFGPTNAKAELFNILKADQSFEKVHIEVMQADKMTEPQQHSFVKDHFSRH